MADPQYSEFNDNPEQLLAKIVNNLGVLAGASGQYPNWYDTKDQLIQKIVDNLGVFAATGGGGGGDVASVNGQTGAVVLTAADVGAAEDNMGEIILKQNAIGTALTDNAPKTVVSLSVPAGDWEIFAQSNDFEPDGGNPLLTRIDSSISLTNNTPDYTQGYSAVLMSAGVLTDVTLLQPRAFFTFAVTTTVYLVSFARFSANGVNVYGTIVARRIPSITVQP